MAEALWTLSDKGDTIAVDTSNKFVIAKRNETMTAATGNAAPQRNGFLSKVCCHRVTLALNEKL
jgi:hypothetical protein